MFFFYFSLGKIFSILLTAIKPSVCYFCFVFTLGPSTILMIENTFTVFLKVYFFLNTDLFPKYRGETLFKQEGAFVCFREGWP